MKRLQDLQTAQLVVCVMLIGGSAIAMWPTLVEPFMLPKVTLILIAATVLIALELARWVIGRRLELAVGWWLLPLAGFAVALVVATAVSETSWLALFGRYSRYTGLLPYLAYLAIALVMVRIDDRRLWQWVARSIVVALGVVAAYTLLQSVGADPFEWPSTPLGDRFSTMGNVNFSAAYLGITLPIAAGVALTGYAARQWRYAAAALVPIGFLAAVLSKSIQGPIAAVAGLGFLAVVVLATRSKAIVAAARSSTSALLLTVSVALVGVAAVATAAYLFVTDIAASLRQRTYFWEAALDMFQSQPLLGVGLEGFANTFLQYRSAEGAVLYGEEGADAPHSVPLAMLADGGLLLAVPYAAFVLVVGFILLQGLRRSEGDARILLAAFGGLWLGYHVQSAVSFDVPPLALLHYVSAAAILRLAGGVTVRTWPRLSAVVTTASRTRRGQAVPERLSPAAKLALALIGVLVLASLAPLTRPLRADVKAVAAANALRERDVAAADAAFADAVRLWPAEPKFRSLRGSFLTQLGEAERGLAAQMSAAQRDPGSSFLALLTARAARDIGQNDVAARWFAEAAERDPVRPEVLAEAGRFFFATRELDRAINLLERARAIHPEPEPLLLLGQAQFARGDAAAARSAFEQALALDPGFEPAVAALAAVDQQAPG